jgi:hypothetical protein
LVDVTVSIDGVVVANKLDGKPIPVDPGAHTFHYESATVAVPIEEHMLIREGETNRTVTVTFPAPPAPVAIPATAAFLPRARSSLAYILGGVGVVTIGLGAALGLSANADVSTAREAAPAGCAPNCPESRVDPIKTKYVLADVSFGVGIVSLGVATYFFFAHRGDPTVDSKQASIGFDIVSATHGGALALVGRF